jgi:hypothetical protein
VPRPTPAGPDHPGDPREGLRWEDRPHLVVPGLVPADAGDGPELRKESWTVRVHGELAAIEPLDASVAAGDDREALCVSGDSETQGTREGTEVLKSGWYGLGHRASWSNSRISLRVADGLPAPRWGGRFFRSAVLEVAGEGVDDPTGRRMSVDRLPRAPAEPVAAWPEVGTVVSRGGFDRRLTIRLKIHEVRVLADIGDDRVGEESGEVFDELGW